MAKNKTKKQDYGCRWTQLWLSVCQAFGGGKQRPDIYNITSGAVYEIKSVNDSASAAPDRTSALYALKAAGLKATPGSSSDIGTYGVVEAPGGYAVFFSPAPGVILYQKFNGSTVEQRQEAYAPNKRYQLFEKKQFEDSVKTTSQMLAVLGAIVFIITVPFNPITN